MSSSTLSTLYPAFRNNACILSGLLSERSGFFGFLFLLIRELQDDPAPLLHNWIYLLHVFSNYRKIDMDENTKTKQEIYIVMRNIG